MAKMGRYTVQVEVTVTVESAGLESAKDFVWDALADAAHDIAVHNGFSVRVLKHEVNKLSDREQAQVTAEQEAAGRLWAAGAGEDGAVWVMRPEGERCDCGILNCGHVKH